MATDKEGVDFEYRTVKGKDGKTLYKTRHFFTAAEKAALKAPKTAPAVAKAPAPTKSAKPKKSDATGVAKDPMKGYRKGDVTTTPIGRTPPKSTADIVAVATKALNKPVIKGSATSSVGSAAVTKKDFNTGKAEARIPVFTKARGEEAKAKLATKHAKSAKEAKPGMSFTEWKSMFAGKQFAPGQALAEYDAYKKRTAGYAKGGMVKKKGMC